MNTTQEIQNDETKNGEIPLSLDQISEAINMFTAVRESLNQSEDEMIQRPPVETPSSQPKEPKLTLEEQIELLSMKVDYLKNEMDTMKAETAQNRAEQTRYQEALVNFASDSRGNWVNMEKTYLARWAVGDKMLRQEVEKCTERVKQLEETVGVFIAQSNVNERKGE